MTNQDTLDRIAAHLASSVTVACDALPPAQGLRVLRLVVASLLESLAEDMQRATQEPPQEG